MAKIKLPGGVAVSRSGVVKTADEIEVGTHISGWVKLCEICHLKFIGRKDARFCSSACRQAAWRRK